MSSGLVLAGLGLAAVGFGGRYLARYGRVAQQTLKKQLDALPQTGAFSKYYKGGFDPKMSKREAGLVLGVSPAASKAKIKEAHKRIMLLNHPDRGGSPFLAAKINEAKDYLDNARPGSS
ncbi:mitochondrial import inner membrane translocase subunit TIM14-like [Haliotis cracherodii]|uniref:mitochondrial import inner membrane translocase subunit TIM14-like n=1 Tax=Haliotis cracherodii TaxID=6455 RepID=UPI0039E9B462